MAFDISGRALHPLSDVLAASDFPLAELVPAGALDQLYYLSAEIGFDQENVVLGLDLLFEEQIQLRVPGTDLIAIVLGSAGPGWTRIAARVVIGPDPSATLESVTVALRVREDVLCDVESNGPAELVVTGDVRVTAAGITLEDFTGVSLRPAYVAETEIIVEAHDVRPVFGSIDSPGWLSDREDFEGLAIDELAVTIPAKYLELDSGSDLRISLQQAAIDASGFSGAVSVESDRQRPITGTFLGFPFRFRHFTLDILENSLRSLALTADLHIRALESDSKEKWVTVDVAFAVGHSLSATLSSTQPADASTQPDALVSFERSGIMQLKLRALTLELREGVFVLFFSGDLHVLVGGGAVKWPQVGFKDLGFDSSGRIVSKDDAGIWLDGALVITLGFVTLTIGKVRLSFDTEGRLDFKPPREVGIVIDSPTVAGAGFLSYDEPKDRFVGAMVLSFGGTVVGAVGVATTRFPDGTPGLSLLVVIAAEFAPLQLGLGFTLNGVGGLLGANRGVAVEALQSGIRDRTLDAVLFVRDPVSVAPTLGDRLTGVFPPERGRWVFGPMVKIGWGSPTLLTVEVALLLELPSPVRLLILGRVRVKLPGPEHPVVNLNLDVFGVIDFDRRELAVDATLYDSFVGPFALTGDMAARVSWGAAPDFAVALGGFHPAFKAPEGFPELRRLALTLSTGNNPRLRMEAYLALTSNTVQIGARLDFYVAAAGFSLEGGFGFDTLITLAPFRLQAEIDSGLALKRGSTTLAHLGVHVNLVGPAPWEVWGTATITILLLDISVPFHATFGEAQALPEPERVDVWALLKAQLAHSANWATQLPSEENRVATLVALPGQGDALVHPLGAVSVTQRLVPLERTLSLFGTAPPAEADYFEIIGGTALVQGDDVYDYFAPAQFRRMSDAEKLSSPSFDRMVSGASFGPPVDEVTIGTVARAPLAYETALVVDLADPTRQRTDRYGPPGDTVTTQAEHGPAALATLRDQGRRKFAPPAPGPVVAEPEYVVATQDTLAAEAVGHDGTYSGAVEAVRQRPDAHRFQIVRREELEVATL